MQKKAFVISILHSFILLSFLIIVGMEQKIYYTLSTLTVVNSIFLIYNLNWMLKELKAMNFENINHSK
jgi:hypothetical protein